MQEIKIKPRILPRDFLDILFGIIWIIMFLVIISSITFFVLILTRDIKIGTFVYYVFLLIPFTFLVYSLTLSDDGIRFNRLLGKPKFLKWSEINDIKEVTRREVLLKGWFTPYILKREPSPSLSLLKYYKISWRSEYCFYPPSNPEQFKKIIRQKLKRKVINK